MDKAVETFMRFQNESEERFLRAEQVRWKREMEYEDRRRKEDREHEIKLMELFMHMQQPYPGPPNTYDYEDWPAPEY